MFPFRQLPAVSRTDTVQLPAEMGVSSAVSVQLAEMGVSSAALHWLPVQRGVSSAAMHWLPAEMGVSSAVSVQPAGSRRVSLGRDNFRMLENRLLK